MMLSLFQKKKILVGLILVGIGTIFFLTFFISQKWEENASRRLAQYGANIPKEEQFVITQSFDDYFIAKSKGRTLKVEIVEGYSEKQAEQYRDEQSMLLEGLYVPQLPPYPEFLMQENACGKKYHPVKRETRHGIFYTLFANDRLGYGVCTDDLIAYRAGLGLLYCPSGKTAIKVEVFTDLNTTQKDMEDFMALFTCIE